MREGSILKDNTYTGLIIRQETTVNAESDGYINYYQNGNSKVKYGAPVYAISKNALNFDDSSTESSSTADLSPDVQSGLVAQLQTFNENYDNSNFSSIYTLKNESQNTLQNAYRTTKTAQLASVIESCGRCAAFSPACSQIAHQDQPGGLLDYTPQLWSPEGALSLGRLAQREPCTHRVERVEREVLAGGARCPRPRESPWRCRRRAPRPAASGPRRCQRSSGARVARLRRASSASSATRAPVPEPQGLRSTSPSAKTVMLRWRGPFSWRPRSSKRMVP